MTTNRQRAEEELGFIFAYYGIPSTMKQETLKFWLMSWFDKHSRPEVTREQIAKVLHGLKNLRTEESIADDLLALLNPTDEPEWCSHMKESERRHKFETGWKFCPICGKERPDA